ncbi:hypothetical protein ACRTC3_16630 [Photobacterium damselae]|uniref:hypothetical protein n=1 Tax=Photobacterium damselae TaxID=38293 RepID=UPI003D7E1FD9
MSGNIIYTVPWVGGTGNIGYVPAGSNSKFDFSIKPDEIDIDYYGVSVNYGAFGMVGEINPESDQWIPSGSVTLIAARYQRGDYNIFLVGNERWNGCESITIRAVAVADSSEVVVNVGYYGVFDRYEASGAAIQEWYDFIKTNAGKEISIYISEYKPT